MSYIPIAYIIMVIITPRISGKQIVLIYVRYYLFERFFPSARILIFTKSLASYIMSRHVIHLCVVILYINSYIIKSYAYEYMAT